MQVTVEQTDPCTIVLDVAIDEQQVAKTFDSVYREFSRYVNVPGFRPGKAPRAILERYVNQDKVRERTLEKLITSTYIEAVQEQGITPFRDPSIEPTDLEDKKPYSYKATVPLEPQITLAEYTGLTVEKPIFAVTDEMVDQRIQQVREDRSRLERITDRGVQTGDVLIAEQQVVLEGEEDPAPGRRQLIQVGNNIPGYDAALEGMMPDEERTFELTYPDDFDEEARRGKKATYTVRLSSISARKLPDLDEEFIKQISPVETLEALKEFVTEAMQAETVRLSDEIAEQRLIVEIVNRAQVFYPDAIVREEMDDDLRNLAAQLKQREMPYEAYLAQIGKTREQHLEEVRTAADARVRALLTLRQIAIQEGLQANDEEVDVEFDRLLNEGKISEDQYTEYKPVPHRRLQVANALVQLRLHDYLFANNTINEVVQTTPPDPQELAEANAEIEA